MHRAFILAVAWVLLAMPPAQAAETPQVRFQAEVGRVRQAVACANQRVQQAVQAQDWCTWGPAHDAYLHTLARAGPDIERAVSTFLVSELATGNQLDAPAMTAIDAAATLAGGYARHRVLVYAYGSLARYGVRPDRRKDALALLARQGIYSLDGRPMVVRPARRPTRSPAEEAESPMCGRVPGSTAATEHLRKWQYAFMRHKTAEQQVVSLEAQLAQLPANAGPRDGVMQRLTLARQQRDALLKAVGEWRTKYYEAGGQ